MLPNIIWFAMKKDTEQNVEAASSVIFTWLENYLRPAYFALLFIVAPTKKVKSGKILLLIGIAAILMYYFCWILYFTHHCRNEYMFRPLAFLPVPMVVFPVIFLVAMALWMNCYSLAAAGTMFGVGHIVNSLSIWNQMSI